MKDLILAGEKLKGVFRGTAKYNEGWAGSEYTERECTYYHYSGMGLIQEGESKHFFSFSTERRESFYDKQQNYTLEESLINFGQRDFKFLRYYETAKNKGVILERYPLLVDFALSRMLAKVKESEEDIPHIVPEEFNLEDLIELGFCYQSNGQMNLLFDEVINGIKT